MATGGAPGTLLAAANWVSWPGQTWPRPKSRDQGGGSKQEGFNHDD